MVWVQSLAQELTHASGAVKNKTKDKCTGESPGETRHQLPLSPPSRIIQILLNSFRNVCDDTYVILPTKQAHPGLSIPVFCGESNNQLTVHVLDLSYSSPFRGQSKESHSHQAEYFKSSWFCGGFFDHVCSMQMFPAMTMPAP